MFFFNPCHEIAKLVDGKLEVFHHVVQGGREGLVILEKRERESDNRNTTTIKDESLSPVLKTYLISENVVNPSIFEKVLLYSEREI